MENKKQTYVPGDYQRVFVFLVRTNKTVVYRSTRICASETDIPMNSLLIDSSGAEMLSSFVIAIFRPKTVLFLPGSFSKKKNYPFTQFDSRIYVKNFAFSPVLPKNAQQNKS